MAKKVMQTGQQMFPQGGNKKVHLMEKFQSSSPFYLNENKPVFARRLNQGNVKSTFEQARARFEDMLKTQEQEDDKLKMAQISFNEQRDRITEIKKLQQSQNVQIMKDILETQMEHEKNRKLASREFHRKPFDMTATNFSSRNGDSLNVTGSINGSVHPIETDETLLVKRMKKKQDQEQMRKDLMEQMRMNSQIKEGSN